MNYFHPKSAAERYAKGRPHFHSNTIKHINEFLQLDGKLENVLDVACGTGLSTKALLEIAENVHGTDISAEMLKHAPLQERIHYAVAPAEQQPFADNFFNLITVSSGVHWFDIDKFLSEANRVLKSGGWLVLYENHFIAEMEGEENFKDWFLNVYLKKFPSPPRNNSYNWSKENMNPKNFDFIKEEKFKNDISFSKQQLSLYFTTQSNIIAAVENNQTTYQQADRWLNGQLSNFFDNGHSARKINYGNWIKYLRKVV